MNWPDRFPVLVTPRLVLRETAARDAEAVFAMESDPVAMRYWSAPPMTDPAQAAASVERAMGYFAQRVGLRWAVTRPEDDRLIGHVSVFAFHEGSGRAEIGYGLAREYWGRGYMNEALTAVVDYAFGPLGLRRLEADTHPRNLASCRALERLGFRREGLMLERWQVGDEVSDSMLWGLLAREWRERRAATGAITPPAAPRT